MTGYKLDKAFKDSLYYFWQAQTSQIYRELDGMEKLGWLESRLVVQSDRPSKRVYSLTPGGKTEFVHWLAAPQGDLENAMKVKNSFLMRIFFAGEADPREAVALLTQYRDLCQSYCQALKPAQEQIANYSAALHKETHAKYWELAVLYGKFYYQASMEWAEQAIQILQKD